MGFVDPAAPLLVTSGGDIVKIFDVTVESGDPCILVYTPAPGHPVNAVKWNHTNHSLNHQPVARLDLNFAVAEAFPPRCRPGPNQAGALLLSALPAPRQFEVKQSDGEIALSQSAYAAKIPEYAGMSDCNACQTPLEERQKLSKDCGVATDATKFRSIIGSVRYIVNTRPDQARSVGVTSRYMEAPGAQHWAAVKHILRYLKGTQSYGLKYRKGTSAEPSLVGFSDSDHAGDPDDRKSTTGVIYFLGSSLITWASQKPKVVALSSCEAEYIAAAATACQGVWLSRLLAELLGTATIAVKLLVDNKSAIALSKNPVHRDRSKHIDTKFHFICECIDDGRVKIDHVGTAGQLADLLTKSFGRVKFVELWQMLGVVDVQRV
ncbi:hypothetical protein BS78_04G150200 [Paspalum vaginatum]|nr:hypothetical protein BS78_04G150200 [Paspalum vaginatum]